MPTYEFGGFRFDPERGLSRDQRSIHIPGQVSRALAALLAARGAIVSKESLAAQAWAGESPSDESVSRCIYLMRRALRHPDDIEVVETLYARGFRITVPVIEVSPRPATVAGRLGTATSIAAFEAFQSGRELIGRRGADDLDLALRAFGRVVEIDPTYVPAWEMIGECRVMQAVRWFVPPRAAARPAHEAVARALAIDPGSVRALATRGWLRGVIDGDLAGGLVDADAAVAGDPQSWQALAHRAWLRGASGRHVEAMNDLRQALATNPFAPGVLGRLAFHLACVGELDEALVTARTATETLPTQGFGWASRGLVAAHAGRHDEAVEAAENAVRLAGNAASVSAILAYALAAADRRADALRVIAGIPKEIGGAPVAPVFVALAHLALGDEAAMSDALARARAARCAWFDLVGYDFRLRPVLERVRAVAG
jgi:DNA-binding winged helix-turn-helix (wHTH) protein/Flp pilus assembly protein TadD